MTFSKLIFVIACLLLVAGCKPKIWFPKNLDEAVVYLKQEWTQAQLDSFKNKPESEAVTEIHFGAGGWIRNNWVYGDTDTTLRHYFDSLGIHAPDDISSIILTSLHRTLNKKDILLNKQVETYKAYWKPINDCNEMQKARAVSTYNRIQEGDSITIYMPVDTLEDGTRNAYLYDCPSTEWTFDAAKDLIVKGTVVNKYFINDTANVFFTVRVTYLNRQNIPILMEQIKTNDKKDFSLTGLTIE